MLMVAVIFIYMVVCATQVRTSPVGCTTNATQNHASGSKCHFLSTSYSLENWMTSLFPAIENLSLLDLSLPGTHDSMTFDLSTTVSDGTNDLPPPIAWVLHEFHDLVPGQFIRNQSKTHGLNLTEQLNNGIRFVDFRIMYTSGPNESASAQHEWYSLHFVQTNEMAITYLTEAKNWMDKHPGEFLVLWLSRHGNECSTGNDQYPDVPDTAKRVFWDEINHLFDGLIFDQSQGLLNATTLATMKQRNQRVVFYVADYARFTGNSSKAIDACQIDNKLGDSVANENATFFNLLERFRNADLTKQNDKSRNKLYLQSMAAGASVEQIEFAALLHYTPHLAPNASEKCAALYKIPGLDYWCPETLMDISLLTNYYNQRILDIAYEQGFGFPNAIYLDALDNEGTIRTGTSLLFNSQKQPSNGSNGSNGSHSTTSYAYVDTLALYNLQRACNQTKSQLHPSVCAELPPIINQRRLAHPVDTWNDPNHGRLVDWPKL